MACYGFASGSPGALLVGAALFVFASSLLLTLERQRNQPEMLRQNLAKLEHERDQLLAANERYRNDNIVLRTMDVAFRDILNLADERTHGQMRILFERGALTPHVTDDIRGAPRQPDTLRSEFAGDNSRPRAGPDLFSARAMPIAAH